MEMAGCGFDLFMLRNVGAGFDLFMLRNVGAGFAIRINDKALEVQYSDISEFHK
jgi:hypothetical protein